MYLRLTIAAVGCFAIGAATLTVAIVCIFGLLEIGCELWLLGPLTAWPLGLGLALLARAARPPDDNDVIDEDGIPSDQT